MAEKPRLLTVLRESWQGLKAIQTVARILVEEKKLVGGKPDWYKILDVSADPPAPLSVCLRSQQCRACVDVGSLIHCRAKVDPSADATTIKRGFHALAKAQPSQCRDDPILTPLVRRRQRTLTKRVGSRRASTPLGWSNR